MKFTVFGSSGFVGKGLVKSLRGDLHEVVTPCRSDKDWLENAFSKDMGHVIYSIGLTANFRELPFETVEAHVTLLSNILKNGKMESLTYLSSTRVYESASETDEEANLVANPANPSFLYNLSKLLGESLSLNSKHKARIIRLSNVYGKEMGASNFLASVLKEAAETGRVKFLTSPDSSKDFIALDDVVAFIPRIILDGKHEIYNLASGINTTNAEIAEYLTDLGVKVSFSDRAEIWNFPVIDISRLKLEFGKPETKLEEVIPDLLSSYR